MSAARTVNGRRVDASPSSRRSTTNTVPTTTDTPTTWNDSINANKYNELRIVVATVEASSQEAAAAARSIYCFIHSDQEPHT
jgi:hypothetical protein